MVDESNGRNVTVREHLTALLNNQSDLEASHFDALQSNIKNFEKRVDEKFTAQRDAVQQATSVLDKRLESMNEFRLQLAQERSSYVTRDYLEAILKSDIRPIQNQQTFQAGRDWALGAMMAFGIAVSGIISSLVAKFG